MTEPSIDGIRLLAVATALANPHRIRVIAALHEGRNYVSQLARDLGISRPLLVMHLQRLEEAGLVSARLELSDQGRAMKYYALEPFSLDLTAQTIAHAASSLPEEG
jgi:DNA-binding transcriptional ArsR family regulator